MVRSLSKTDRRPSSVLRSRNAPAHSSDRSSAIDHSVAARRWVAKLCPSRQLFQRFLLISSRSPTFQQIAAVSLDGAHVLLPSLSLEADLLRPAGDRATGAESAPVTVIEYSSPTCPHCLNYRRHVAPKIDVEFVSTGKVKILFGPLARNNIDLACLRNGRVYRRHVKSPTSILNITTRSRTRLM
ncbi:thioredoxin domain-containing protein [Sinorhizobium terangae]|uniref:Thioredoxin domain-containing protein n=1 Tax=Sinorhizobium terangae TaxID=110322 RepID=A0A6N7LJN8_SINTE|nr:thioredoxin domain-containing protein [Sinorhizobium terangae]